MYSVWIGPAGTAEGKVQISSREIALAARRCEPCRSQVSPEAGREETTCLSVCCVPGTVVDLSEVVFYSRP